MCAKTRSHMWCIFYSTTLAIACAKTRQNLIEKIPNDAFCSCLFNVKQGENLLAGTDFLPSMCEQLTMPIPDRNLEC